MCLLVVSRWQCRKEELTSWQGHESSTVHLGHLNASLNLERDEIVLSNASFFLIAHTFVLEYLNDIHVYSL